MPVANTQHQKRIRVKNGVIVMFDGPDGVGKSTQLQLATQDLEAQGYTIHTTRVVDGTPIGEALRKVLFADFARSPKTDLFIARAMYAELCEDLQKERQQAKIILVDRSP